MPEKVISENLLIKVIKDLKDYLPNLVLVGGWVPHIYSEYVWKKVIVKVKGTTDIDFAVKSGKLQLSEPISSKLKALNYGERHARIGKLYPYVPLVKGKKDFEVAEVEFITSQKPSKYLIEKLLGKQIKLEKLKYTEFLFTKTLEVKLSKVKINVPDDARFVFHKLLTFVGRNDEFKAKKDLYYSYYMLRFSPQCRTICERVRNLVRRSKLGSIVSSNIDNYFKTENSKGPISIELENGPDYFIKDIRQDAFKRLTKIIR